MNRCAIACLVVVACAACERPVAESPNGAASVNQQSAGSTEIAPEEIRPGEPGGLPDDRNLVEEGTIDPKSPQGAGQVLQSYAALLEQGRFADARSLWSDGGNASGMSGEAFARALGKYAAIHAEIGAAGAMEGAAGSSYVEIPVRLYGERPGGAQFNSIGSVTLKRVNDIPGSTPEQRRWRIYRLEVQPPL